MKPRSLAAAILTIAIVAVGVAVLAGGGSAKAHSPQAAAGSAVSVRHTSLGQTLVDARGRTLYLFKADKTDHSTLSAAGRAVWPPFTAAGTVKAKGGAQAAKLGTIKGQNGTRQVTYDGHPLYYYVGDHGAGSTHGQGLLEFGARWFVLAANGNANTTKATAASAPATPAPAPAPAAAGSFGY